MTLPQTVGLLQAPLGTRLYERMQQEGRLIDEFSGDNVDGSTNIIPFTHPTRIWAGDYADCASAAVTIITAGLARLKPGQTRLDLAKANASIFLIVPQVVAYNPDGMILVASNPVDAMTYLTLWYQRSFPEFAHCN